MRYNQAVRADTRTSCIWIHALGAKAGGGITYFQAVLPELFRQLEGTGTRVVLLVPNPPRDIAIPDFCEVRVLRRAASSRLWRLVFDQILLPLQLARVSRATLFCSGNFAPFIKAVPTVVLIRNAIYFDGEFLRRERWMNRQLLRLQGAIIRATARGCRAAHYPSLYMRKLAERNAPSIVKLGVVNSYGVREEMVAARDGRALARRPGDRIKLLYVMTYTLQKNLGYLLQALRLARDRGTAVQVVVTSWLDDSFALVGKEDRAFIEQNNLVDSGYLLPVGPKYGADLVRLYKEADACVFPSICESFGHPLVEALAVGRPILCADRQYAREICGDQAQYFDPERPEDLVRLWEKWPEITATYTPPDLDMLRDRFSWSRHVSVLLDSLLGMTAT